MFVCLLMFVGLVWSGLVWFGWFVCLFVCLFTHRLSIIFELDLDTVLVVHNLNDSVHCTNHCALLGI